MNNCLSLRAGICLTLYAVSFSCFSQAISYEESIKIVKRQNLEIPRMLEQIDCEIDRQPSGDAPKNNGLEYSPEIQSLIKLGEKNGAAGLAGLKLLAEKGNAEAMQYIGVLHANGEWSLKQDYDEAWRWFVRASAKGNLFADRNLGLMLLFGQGGYERPDQAFHRFLRGIRRGHHGRRTAVDLIHALIVLTTDGYFDSDRPVQSSQWNLGPDPIGIALACLEKNYSLFEAYDFARLLGSTSSVLPPDFEQLTVFNSERYHYPRVKSRFEIDPGKVRNNFNSIAASRLLKLIGKGALETAYRELDIKNKESVERYKKAIQANYYWPINESIISHSWTYEKIRLRSPDERCAYSTICSALTVNGYGQSANLSVVLSELMQKKDGDSEEYILAARRDLARLSRLLLPGATITSADRYFAYSVFLQDASYVTPVSTFIDSVNTLLLNRILEWGMREAPAMIQNGRADLAHDTLRAGLMSGKIDFLDYAQMAKIWNHQLPSNSIDYENCLWPPGFEFSSMGFRTAFGRAPNCRDMWAMDLKFHDAEGRAEILAASSAGCTGSGTGSAFLLSMSDCVEEKLNNAGLSSASAHPIVWMRGKVDSLSEFKKSYVQCLRDRYLSKIACKYDAANALFRKPVLSRAAVTAPPFPYAANPGWVDLLFPMSR
ncbi:MAG: sel1 repeat family protein [Nevskiaceae bacterium]|nr:MAG: sel1 repeat family protein [Nevskiaceae bacterium]TAM22259.1 MAG: sel1 repeat family protein [Nevskiaceae bacterium]